LIPVNSIDIRDIIEKLAVDRAGLFAAASQFELQPAGYSMLLGFGFFSILLLCQV